MVPCDCKMVIVNGDDDIAGLALCKLAEKGIRIFKSVVIVHFSDDDVNHFNVKMLSEREKKIPEKSCRHFKKKRDAQKTDSSTCFFLFNFLKEKKKKTPRSLNMCLILSPVMLISL